MTDPALKQPLEGDEIEHLARGADYHIVGARTPGAGRLSSPEWWLLFGGMFVVGGALYIHVDVWPFLPFEVAPEDVSCLTGLALVAMLIGGLLLLLRLSMVAVAGAFWVWHRLFPRNPRVRCPECGAWDSVSHLVDAQGCWRCGSDLVYCAGCGKPRVLGRFLSGEGCPDCGHKEFATWL